MCTAWLIVAAFMWLVFAAVDLSADRSVAVASGCGVALIRSLSSTLLNMTAICGRSEVKVWFF